MIDWLKELDQEVFLFFNGFHNPFFDDVMWFITNKFVWIPLYLYFIFLIFKTYKKAGVIWLAGILILIILTDQFTSSILKPYFGRLRPCHDPELNFLVHNYKKCGGLYSFVSGHSANAFAFATFAFHLFKGKIKYIGILFFWAALVAYTRVYLGVHYPGDIIMGGLIGSFFAWIFFLISRHFYQKRMKKLSK